MDRRGNRGRRQRHSMRGTKSRGGERFAQALGDGRKEGGGATTVLYRRKPVNHVRKRTQNSSEGRTTSPVTQKFFGSERGT